ncbi:adenine deaminase [Variovorax sp. SCN 67-85]|uniref:adenine deaminase n=1 Tax=Variovorax sp. SCN 67-85 TaxID=1660152 RepID=UPI000A45358D|nr:adenine deaminase [Variovorax sp. SCN 67-85]
MGINGPTGHIAFALRPPYLLCMRDPLSPSQLADIVDQARGKVPADLVVKSVGIFDLTSGEVTVGDIAIAGDRIVGIHETYRGATEIDGRGLVAVPGFIDSHVHCESTLVPPLEFDRCVTPRGTTTAICDPHEICNVLGLTGLKYFLECAAVTVMDLRVQLSSCVPATHLETSGARLEAEDLLPFKHHPKVLGLAEFMNVPGVLNKDPAVLAKLAAFSDVQIDGHSPLLSSYDLNAYIAAGVRNCHETTSAAEAREKLAKGMQVLVREGTVSKDLAALSELITTERAPFLALCTDDRNPLDIAEEGHVDYLIRAAIGRGVRPLDAYRAATWSAARHFGLFDRGLVAPGQRADIVLLEDLATCKVHSVICRGAPVTPDRFRARPDVPPVGLDSVKLRPVTAATFYVPAGHGPGADVSPPVIGIRPGQILTDRLDVEVARSGDALVADISRDVLKIAVLGRHNDSGNVGRGFVKGFGLKRGAIASSVGHDSHNICVIGCDDRDMETAVNRLIELRGGFAAAADGEIVAELALPIAGLMSERPFEEVEQGLRRLRAAVRALGTELHEPFLQMAFLPLPVIPHLRITDRGLVDVDRFELVV